MKRAGVVSEIKDELQEEDLKKRPFVLNWLFGIIDRLRGLWKKDDNEAVLRAFYNKYFELKAERDELLVKLKKLRNAKPDERISPDSDAAADTDTPSVDDANSQNDSSAEIDKLNLEIHTLQEQLATKDEQIEQLSHALSEMQATIHSTEHLGDDVLLLKNRVFDDAARLIESLNTAVSEITDIQAGTVLSAYLTFSHIEGVFAECIQLSDQLNPKILGQISSYRSAVLHYSALLSEQAKCVGIPTIGLHEKIVTIRGQFIALKELQDQLISEQVGESVGEEEDEAESAVDIPSDWIYKVSTGSEYLCNFFSVLGLSEDSSVDDVKAAFRAAALKYHSDRKADELYEKYNRLMRLVIEADKVLKDPVSRASYIHLLEQNRGSAIDIEGILRDLDLNVADFDDHKKRATG